MTAAVVGLATSLSEKSLPNCMSMRKVRIESVTTSISTKASASIGKPTSSVGERSFAHQSITTSSGASAFSMKTLPLPKKPCFFCITPPFLWLAHGPSWNECRYSGRGGSSCS